MRPSPKPDLRVPRKVIGNVVVILLDFSFLFLLSACEIWVK